MRHLCQWGAGGPELALVERMAKHSQSLHLWRRRVVPLAQYGTVPKGKRLQAVMAAECTQGALVTNNPLTCSWRTCICTPTPRSPGQCLPSHQLQQQPPLQPTPLLGQHLLQRLDSSENIVANYQRLQRADRLAEVRAISAHARIPGGSESLKCMHLTGRCLKGHCHPARV